MKFQLFYFKVQVSLVLFFFLEKQWKNLNWLRTSVSDLVVALIKLRDNKANFFASVILRTPVINSFYSLIIYSLKNNQSNWAISFPQVKVRSHIFLIVHTGVDFAEVVVAVSGPDHWPLIHDQNRNNNNFWIAAESFLSQGSFSDCILSHCFFFRIQCCNVDKKSHRSCQCPLI